MRTAEPRLDGRISPVQKVVSTSDERCFVGKEKQTSGATSSGRASLLRAGDG